MTTSNVTVTNYDDDGNVITSVAQLVEQLRGPMVTGPIEVRRPRRNTDDVLAEIDAALEEVSRRD